MEKNSKINVVEGMFMLILAVIADVSGVAGIAGLAIPLVGVMFPIIAWFCGIAIWLILLFWLNMKGVSVKWLLGGGIGELIPILNALPFYTLAIIATIVEDNLPPKAKEAVGKATKFTKPIK
ncbi:MAG: hypothetical protein Q7S73_01435 [bacterium]|nr:hypothetical protein [bacterium]